MNIHRGVIRANYISYKCKQSNMAGGCADMRNIQEEEKQLQMLINKWGSKIVKKDISKNQNTKKEKIYNDYNPIIHIPIGGI